MRLKADIETMRKEALNRAAAARMEGDEKTRLYFLGVATALGWVCDKKNENTIIIKN